MPKDSRKFENDNIWPKEKKMIMTTIDRYGLNILEIVRVRSAYKIICKEGVFCLKRMKHGRHKVKNGYLLVEYLKNNDFFNIANYIKTKEDKYYFEYDKYILYLTEWIDGEECKIDSIEESINCAKLLAQFHLAVSGIDTTKLTIKSNLKNWPKIFLSNLYGLEQFKRIISKKKLRNDFDNVYYDHIDTLYNRGLLALNILNKSDYYKLSKISNDNKTLCHDSFYYQNILKKDEKYYLVDLDSIIVDLQINDLGKFIRRIMYKKEYKWDFDKAKSIIEAYSLIKPITAEELEVMLSLIIFPHKFWKLGKKRYSKNKHWNETKYMHKLNKIIMYNELQDIFIEKYIAYIDSLNSKQSN